MTAEGRGRAQSCLRNGKNNLAIILLFKDLSICSPASSHRHPEAPSLLRLIAVFVLLLVLAFLANVGLQPLRVSLSEIPHALPVKPLLADRTLDHRLVWVVRELAHAVHGDLIGLEGALLQGVIFEAPKVLSIDREEERGMRVGCVRIVATRWQHPDTYVILSYFFQPLVLIEGMDATRALDGVDGMSIGGDALDRLREELLLAVPRLAASNHILGLVVPKQPFAIKKRETGDRGSASRSRERVSGRNRGPRPSVVTHFAMPSLCEMETIFAMKESTCLPAKMNTVSPSFAFVLS